MAAGEAGRQEATPSRGLLVALMVVAAVSSVAPWLAKALGMELPVATSLEIVDHVVPGVVIIVAAIVVATGRLPLFGTLIATLVAALAGLWMTATHVPLLLQARMMLVEWPTALTHSIPGILTFLLTLPPAVWAWRRQAAVEAAASGKGSARAKGAEKASGNRRKDS